MPNLAPLQAASETLRNRALRNIDDAAVREGTLLSREPCNTKTFPAVLVHLIRSGK